jgi:hypothetical protein
MQEVRFELPGLASSRRESASSDGGHRNGACIGRPIGGR